MPNWETVLVEYQNRLQGLQAGVLHTQAAQSRFALLTAGLAVLVIVCLIGFAKREATAWAPVLLAPCAAWSLRKYLLNRQESIRLWRLKRFYESGVDRLNGTWVGAGDTGEEFSTESHLYEKDLNVLGRGSMFELLCTARTGLGRRRLASYLLDLPQSEETIARQGSVKELQSRTDLRERTWLLGRHSFQNCEWEPFHEWQKSPSVLTPWVLSGLSFICSCAIVPLVLIPWLAPPGAGLWTEVFPFLAAALLVQATCGFLLRERTRPALEGIRGIGSEVALFRQGLELIEAQQFLSPKLVRLRESVTGASHAMRRLERMIRAVEECNKEWFDLPSRVLLTRTQLALAVERWRDQHTVDLEIWLNAWAEFEALNCFGVYAHEHPEDVFPEMAGSTATFDASALGHPLLPQSTCVRNDVHLGSIRRFYLVSGSNMAGKSTLLRTIGLNAVLASAGAPVRALKARIASFGVCASISIVDSMVEGKSKFMMEVQRLRDTLGSYSGQKPVLFVIDEILSGTNSRDRRVAAESFLRALIGAGAVGALSTHDLALAEIAEDRELDGTNVHMESRDPSDPFAFDYLWKPGVSTHSNALAIARLAGVDA
jgi:hypothetical protein